MGAWIGNSGRQAERARSGTGGSSRTGEGTSKGSRPEEVEVISNGRSWQFRQSSRGSQSW